MNESFLSDTIRSLCEILEVTPYDGLKLGLLLFCQFSVWSTGLEYLASYLVENPPKISMEVFQVVSINSFHESANHLALRKRHHRHAHLRAININGILRMRFKGIPNSSIGHDLD